MAPVLPRLPRLARLSILSMAVCGGLHLLAGSTGRAFAQPAPAAPPPPARVTPRLLIQSDAAIWRHGPSAPALEDAATHPGLYLRRARLGADIDNGPWRARLIIEGASSRETVDASGVGTGAPPAAVPGANGLDAAAGEIGGVTPRPTEAFLAFAPHEAFVLAAGSLRVPIGLSRQVDEADLRLPERPRFVTRSTPDFRVGARAAGDLGLLQYAFGIYGAAPRFGATPGSGYASGGALYVLRLSGEPVGPMGSAPHLRRRDDPWYRWWRFSTGLSIFHLRLPGDNEWGLGGDGQFQWRRFCVTGEVLWTRRATTDRVGFNVEPGLFLIPERVELVTRLEWFNDRVGPTSPLDAWGASAGATFFSATRLVRAQIAYSWRRPLSGDDRVLGWLLVRVTFTL